MPNHATNTSALLAIVLAALAAACGGERPAEPLPDRPNIVFILADDVGDQAIGCYGGQSYATPRIDALAAGGMRFEHCYAMPKCHPSRLAFLTGQYPHRLGDVAWGSFPRASESSTVAARLRDLGYATAAVGKWQLTLLGDEPDHPRRLGFDRWSLFGWHEGPRYYQPMIYEDGIVREDVADRYGPDVYLESLIGFIERNRAGPFFAYYSMALAHDVTDDIGTPPPLGPEGRYDSYKEMVEGMDLRVGRLVDALDRLGIRDRTLVIFTGDNGTPERYYAGVRNGELFKDPIEFVWNGTPVVGGKGDLTDAGTRVPMVASWPGTIRPGQVIDDLVDFSDWLPTFVDLAGGERSDGLDGRSFAGRLRSAEGPQRAWAHASDERMHWVRTQRWKLYADGRLFDMDGTRVETQPLAAGEGGEDAARAREILTAALRQLEDPN